MRRVPTGDLEVPLPGVAVIRDSTSWKLLWRRFESVASRDGELIRHDVPRVDFSRDMLIAVGVGSLSGCANEARFINRVTERDDSIIVEMGSEYTGPEVTCMMAIDPVDVVRVPRSDKPVAFRSRWTYRDVPPPAPWWDMPSWEELDTMERTVRAAYILALARDPRLTARDLREVASRADGLAGMYLIRNPLVQADYRSMVELARVRGVGRDARALLFERHGKELAPDSQASSDALRLLIDELGRRRAEDYTNLVHALLDNPKVRDSRDLLGALIWAAQRDPRVIQEGCGIYSMRWSLWRAVRDPDGNPTGARQKRVPC